MRRWCLGKSLFFTTLLFLESLGLRRFDNGTRKGNRGAI